MLLECAEVVGSAEVVASAWRHKIKCDVDAWVIKYEKWMIKLARYAQRHWKQAYNSDLWEDLKAEMILEAYRAGERYNADRGDLSKFLIGTLWHYATKPEVVFKYIAHKNRRGVYCAVAEEDNDWVDASQHIPDKHEISSLEYSADVFLLLDQLSPDERDFVAVKFRLGISCNQMDELTGVGSGVTSYRINRAINKLKVSGDGRCRREA